MVSFYVQDLINCILGFKYQNNYTQGKDKRSHSCMQKVKRKTLLIATTIISKWLACHR